MERAGIVAGSPLARQVAATLNAICSSEQLPGPADAEVMVPPTGRALVRRVVGANAWIYFRVLVDGRVLAMSLLTQPPFPLDV